MDHDQHSLGGAILGIGSPLCRTRRRIPSGSIGLFLELRVQDQRIIEIDRIFDDSRHDHPDLVVGFLERIEIFGELRARAVRHAIFAEIPGAQVRGDDLQTSDSRRSSFSCHLVNALSGGGYDTLPFQI